ncbi:hypothetical protein BP5796_02379 [Coleophoma crateriformis]|uniref:RlpA-like protein double-psi beta-barrel domain-containing protein n=1 Tax=Coleophoma crateriformis TaxID=565419 RepID=A0A3D8SY62_9HELO|nr:hypothetical protein BP5796_02379 [Coleophoma crateriformis]
MKSTTLLMASLLASSALAQPHRQRHRHAQHQRDLEVVWVTETDWVTDVIGVTSTVWVSPGFVAPTEATTESSTTTQAAAEFFQGASSAPSAPSTSVYVAPSSSAYVAPVETPSSSAYVAPVETSTPAATSTTPAYVAPVAESSSSSTPAQVYTPPAASTSVYSAPEPTTSTAAAAAATTAASSLSGSIATTGSTTGTCEGSGNICQGDITYYTAGLGACGLTTDGDNENVVALPHDFMGTQSNGNPYCGKTVTIYCVATGKSTQATVVDKCMGCTGRSIDLSIKAMAALDPNYETVGRETATWWFN